MENTMEVPQKTKNRVTIWSSNPTLGHISTENSNSKRYMHPSVHSSTIYNSQHTEATQVSIDRWMDKEEVVHICNGILLNHKKEWNNAFAATWMDLEIIILSEVSQTEKNKYHDITYTWKLKKWYKLTYLQKRNRLTDTENKLMVTKGEAGGGIN